MVNEADPFHHPILPGWNDGFLVSEDTRRDDKANAWIFDISVLDGKYVDIQPSLGEKAHKHMLSQNHAILPQHSLSTRSQCQDCEEVYYVGIIDHSIKYGIKKQVRTGGMAVRETLKCPKWPIQSSFFSLRSKNPDAFQTLDRRLRADIGSASYEMVKISKNDKVRPLKTHEETSKKVLNPAMKLCLKA